MPFHNSSYGQQCCTGRRWTGCQHGVNCGSDLYTGQSRNDAQFACFVASRRGYRHECATNCGCPNCPTGQFQTSPPGTFNNRGCGLVSNCNAGTYMSVPHTTNVNRQCSECPPGTFTHTPNQDTCRPHTTCTKAEYISSAVFTYRDRICSVCLDTTYQNDTHHQETECKKQITCGLGESFVDDNSKTEEGSCEACKDGTFQSMETHRNQCIVHNVCNIEKGQSTAVEPTPTSDRICATSQECTKYQYESQALTPTTQRQCGYRTTCSNGEYVTADPTPTSDRTCADCDGEVEYSNKTNSASCTALDTCAKGEFVAVPGSRRKPLVCKECPGGQWQSLTGKRPETCFQQPRCAKGEKLLRADATKQGYCALCDAGQYVEDDNHRDANCRQQPYCNENEYLANASIASEGVCTTCPAGSEQHKQNTRASECTQIVYAFNNTGTDTNSDTLLARDYNSTMQTQDRQQSGSWVADIVGGIIGGLFAVVATVSVVLHFRKQALATARQHNGGGAGMEHAELQQSTAMHNNRLMESEINDDADYISALRTDAVDTLASAQDGGTHDDASGSANERSRHPPLAPPTPTPPALYDEVDEISNATSPTGFPAAQPCLDVDGYVFDSSVNRTLQDAEYAIAASSTSEDANYFALTSSAVTYKRRSELPSSMIYDANDAGVRNNSNA